MLPNLRQSLAVLAPLLALVGCSSEAEFSTDVAGNYTVALTNRASSCDFKDWVEGKETTGVGFNITQDGDNLHATLDGLTATFFSIWLGSADFSGKAERSSLELTNYGTRSQSQGNCTFTYDAIVAGTLVENAVSGTITYSPSTNGSPDCAGVECEAVQDFSGSRPPR